MCCSSTTAIQRIEAPGQHSRLAVITPNKKQTLKHMVPLDETPQSLGRKCCISNFPSGLEAPVSLLVFHLSRFYCITLDRGADSCLYCVSIYFLSTQLSLQPYVPHHVAETHSCSKSLNPLALDRNHKRWRYTAASERTLRVHCNGGWSIKSESLFVYLYVLRRIWDLVNPWRWTVEIIKQKRLKKLLWLLK